MSAFKLHSNHKTKTKQQKSQPNLEINHKANLINADYHKLQHQFKPPKINKMQQKKYHASETSACVLMRSSLPKGRLREG